MKFTRLAATPVAAVIALAACGSSTSISQAKTNGHAEAAASPALTMAVLQAFTGPNGYFGASYLRACTAATKQVNRAGGILGHQIVCATYDTKGDPTDAVPVANRMVAQASNLVGILGPGPEAPATLPITSQAKIPDFLTTGDPSFDNSTDPYFFRITPSDSTQGTALGYYAAKNGDKRVASVFTSDTGAQTSVPSFKKEFKKLGGRIVADLTITPGALSYRTEVERVLKAKPQAIVSEMDARTAATFLSEMAQLNNGHVIPIISTQRTIVSDWVTAVSHAIGGSALARSVKAVAPYSKLAGPGYAAAKVALSGTLHTKADVNNPFVLAMYDAVNIDALAMVEAKSTNPATFARYITGITAAKPGAAVVPDFRAGVAALRRGKKIQYVGGSGTLPFDVHHNVKGLYAIYQYSVKAKSFNPTHVLPPIS